MAREDLGADEIEEILTRLPVKDVLRCKLLSKTCYALIKNRSFINKHLHHHHRSTSTTHNIIIITEKARGNVSGRYNNIVPLLPSPSPIDLSPFGMFTSALMTLLGGSCNGLLCVLVWKSNARTYLLWNPAIREYWVFSNPVSDYCNALGFGYDAASDDYKLVKIWGRDSNYLSELWSKKTNTWRDIEIGFVLPNTENTSINIELDSVGLLTRGSLYWLVCAIDKNGPRRRTFLLSFDLVRDCFCPLIALPAAPVEFSQVGVIDFMGSFALFIRLPADDVSSKFIYEIWLMDEDNKNSWTKQLSIGPFSPQVWPTRICMNGKFVMKNEGARGSYSSKYFSYDHRNEEQKELPCNLYAPTHRFFPPCSYTESLVSVNPACNNRLDNVIPNKHYRSPV